ncbi:MAG TPA: disulfide bond formation protein B, partial [Candidatus Paceibacterota bacterium]|nr:disulfide bond formation protein B [Candidatus Paceibacterota bacterium]
MPAFVSTLIFWMAIGTVVLDVSIVVKIAMLLFPRSRAHLLRRERDYGLLAIFVLSTLAVAGTLLMQFAGGLTPCILCWWQRIFMYPIPLITLIALIKGVKMSDVADYILGLSFIGGLFALYQHLLQVLPSGVLIPCDPTNDCAIRTIFYFNFVTIPW